MCKDRGIFSTTCCDGDFFTGMEEIITDYRVVNFRLEDVIEAFFAKFLGCFWPLLLILLFKGSVPSESVGEYDIAHKQL